MGVRGAAKSWIVFIWQPVLLPILHIFSKFRALWPALLLGAHNTESALPLNPSLTNIWHHIPIRNRHTYICRDCKFTLTNFRYHENGCNLSDQIQFCMCATKFPLITLHAHIRQIFLIFCEQQQQEHLNFLVLLNLSLQKTSWHVAHSSC